MAKEKATWEWRGKIFATKADLEKHLKERARTELQGLLGPPVTEIQGDDHQFCHVHFKVQISMGTKPSRQTTAKPQSTPVPSKSKGKKLKQPSKTAIDKEHKKYFG